MNLLKLARHFEKMTKSAQTGPNENDSMASYHHVEAQVKRMSLIVDAALKGNPGALDLQQLDTVFKSWAAGSLNKDDISLIRKSLVLRGIQILSKYPNCANVLREFNGLISQMDQEMAVIKNVSAQPLPPVKPIPEMNVHDLPDAPKPAAQKPRRPAPASLMNGIENAVQHDKVTKSIEDVIRDDSKDTPNPNMV